MKLSDTFTILNLSYISSEENTPNAKKFAFTSHSISISPRIEDKKDSRK
jgi:hypothetical protein